MRTIRGGRGGELTPFEPGERRVGRPAGVPNKTTRVLKEAGILAAEIVGFPRFKRDKHGDIVPGSAGSFQVHEMAMEKGVAKMRQLKDGLEIKPGQTVELKPGGTHVMLVDLKKPLSKDDHFKATLDFEKAGMAEVEFDVLAMGATPSRQPAGKQTHHH